MEQTFVRNLCIMVVFLLFAYAPAEPPRPLVEARKAVEQQSYAVAAKFFEEALAQPLGEGERREALYGRALCALKLGETEQARHGFETVLREPKVDRWRALALWHMAVARTRDSVSEDETTSLTQEIEEADQSISQTAPEYYGQFTRSVVDEVFSQWWPANSKQREFQIKFFDKAIAAAKNEADIAELLRRRAELRLQGDGNEQTYLKDLRTIVTEFPKTAAARQAQLTIAQRLTHAHQGDLKAALAEWKKIIELWPNSPEAREAQRNVEQITQEYLDIEIEPSVGTDKPIEVRLAARNASSCEIAFYQVHAPEALKVLQRDPSALEKLLKGNQPAVSRRVEFPTRDDYRGTTACVVFDPRRPSEQLARGMYVVQCSGKKARSYRLLVVGDLVLLGATSGPEIHFWTLDAKDGRPRPNTRILLLATGRVRTRPMAKTKAVPTSDQEVIELQTDERGFGEFQVEDGRTHLEFSALALDGNECALLTQQSSYYQPRLSELTCYAYTDRPVYRPGDKLYWRAIVRERNEGLYHLPKTSKFQVTLLNARGEKVGSQECETSEFGTIAGDWTVGEGSPLGMWRISVATSNGSVIGSAQFRVEEYKKPEFEVVLTSADKLVRLGSSVDVAVSARYLFGAPVANASVHYTVSAYPRYWWRPLPPWSRAFAWFDADSRTDRPHYFWRVATRVAEGNMTTDRDGHCTITFLAIPPKADQSEWASYDFQVTASVTDPSRRTIDGSTVIAVGKKALDLHVFTERRVLSPGDLARVTIMASNISGEPVAARGVMAVEKLTWDEKLQEDIPTTLSLEKVEISAGGEGTYEWRIPRDFAGRLRFVFIAEDPFAGSSVGSCVLDVADAGTKDLGIRYQGLQLIADKTSYEIGDTARILVLSEYPDLQAQLWVDTGSGFLTKKLLPLKYRTNVVELPITQAYVPNVRVGIVAVRDRRVFTHDLELLVPPKQRILQVQVSTDRASYTPRDRGTLQLSVRTWDGKPVQGEFSVSCYDKAIEYIQPSLRRDLRQYFYGQKRPIEMAIANSLVAPAYCRSTNPPAGPYDYDLFASLQNEAGEERLFYRDSIPRRTRAELAMMPAAAPEEVMAKSAVGGRALADSIEAKDEFAQPILRTDFRDSILWLPKVLTDKNGQAQVSVDFPDSLTTWRIEVVGIDDQHRVGEDSTLTLVQKKLSARLALPRFLVERDVATVSAIVRNDFAATKTVQVRFKADGVIPLESLTAGEELQVELPPAGEKRLDWQVEATTAGIANFRVTALARGESDALETSIPVIAHGIDKKVFRVGSTTDVSTGTRRIVRENNRTMITDQIFVPADRIPATTRLTLRLSPSLAAQLREALPYLVEYPYGCVEQTMSRFLPAAIVAKTFQDLDIPRDEILQRRLPDVLRAGIKRLHDFQHSNGSWGWWKDGPTDDYITAHVMFGLTLAREADCEIPEEMFEKALNYLAQAAGASAAVIPSSMRSWHYDNLRELHALAYEALVLAMNKRPSTEALNHLWEERAHLSPAGLAMFGRALALSGQNERANIVLRNLMNFAVQVPDNDTIHWESRSGSHWFWWWNDAVEATCHALMAFLEASPQAPEVDAAVKWLVLNRRGGQWKSTKDTGLAVMALANYLRVRRPDARETKIVAQVGSLAPREFKLAKDNFFTAAPEIVLEGKDVPSGQIPLKLEVQGSAPVYYTFIAEYFTLEEPITSASHELVVERVYERCIKSEKLEDGSIKDVWTRLHDGDEIQSGERIRVTLHTRAWNDYEYLVFEDPKPAGCETVEVQSGWTCEGGLCCYREFRDQMVTSFVSKLPQGEHRLSYELRAETPGKFHTLPARGYAMYFPDLYGNSDELRITIRDKK